MNDPKMPIQESSSNVLKKDILSITMSAINRMKIEDKSEQTITSYVRAVERLVRYTHQICISNFRMEHIDPQNVTFRYLDRIFKQSKSMTLTGVQFLKHFAEHILPKGFVTIRHVGFLSC